MRILMGLLILAACVAIAAAAEPQPAAKNPAVTASNSFACDLFKQLSSANAGKNVFFSPYSISSALAMTLEGARGDTALEMGQTLRLPEDLKANSTAQPWAAGVFSLGFNEFNRSITSSNDRAKADGVRKQIAVLRKELAAANEQVRKAQEQKKFRELDPLQQQASKLAASINLLSKQVDQYELKVANALFGEKTYPFKKDFIEAVDKNFGSGHLREADFRNNFPAERTLINRWVQEQTNDRIKDLIPNLPPELAKQMRLILINAIFFKGEWSSPFDEKQTKIEDFLLSGGGKAPTKIMHHLNKDARYAAFNGDGSYFNTPHVIGFDGNAKTYPDPNGFQIAEIPVKGDRLSMVILAPRSVDGLNAIEAKLSGEMLTGWLAKLQKRSVNLAIPRFKMETDYSLGEPLKELGMKKAFEERIADFTGMSDSTNPDDRLFIAKVLHKAFVEVNEKGAEAAAATAVMMAMPTSAPVSRPFNPEFRADRPFLFLIRDMDTGMILFLGRMTQPV